MPHTTKTSNIAICFLLVNEILSQQQKNLIGNSHVTDDVIP